MVLCRFSGHREEGGPTTLATAHRASHTHHPGISCFPTQGCKRQTKPWAPSTGQAPPVGWIPPASGTTESRTVRPRVQVRLLRAALRLENGVRRDWQRRPSAPAEFAAWDPARETHVVVGALCACIALRRASRVPRIPRQPSSRSPFLYLQDYGRRRRVCTSRPLHRSAHAHPRCSTCVQSGGIMPRPCSH